MSGETDQVRWRGVRPVDGIRGVWPERNAERVYGYKYNGASALEIVYTVPANKTLFMANIQMSAISRVNQWSSSTLQVRDDEDDLAYTMVILPFFLTGQANDSLSASPALEASAGWDVILSNSAGDMESRAIFFGWLEDA